jgi:DNA-binding transcriptional LysR family regulator
MDMLKVAFQPLPVARWASLFHILLLESPDVRLEWVAVPFPRRDRPLLAGADVGLFLEPPCDPLLSRLEVGSSGMAVLMPAGHRLGRADEVRVADILDEPFADDPMLHPEWKAFWTLDAYRGGPPPRRHPGVADPAAGIEAVAGGHVIATFPQFLADGLPHPGLIWMPLADGPRVAMCLVWRASETNLAVRRLVDIARDLFAREPGDESEDPGGDRAVGGQHA